METTLQLTKPYLHLKFKINPCGTVVFYGIKPIGSFNAVASIGTIRIESTQCNRNT